MTPSMIPEPLHAFYVSGLWYAVPAAVLAVPFILGWRDRVSDSAFFLLMVCLLAAFLWPFLLAGAAAFLSFLGLWALGALARPAFDKRFK